MIKTNEKVIIQVKQRVLKEFKEFRNECFGKGHQYIFDNALKVAFYQEIKVYILNGFARQSYYLEMNEMNHILDTLWNRYKKGVIDWCGNHFLEQLLDFHLKNKERCDSTL